MFHPVLEAEVSTAMRETLPEAPPLAISFLRLSSSTTLWTAVAAPSDSQACRFYLVCHLLSDLGGRPDQALQTISTFVARRRGGRVPTGCHDRSAPGVAWVCQKVCADNLTGLVIRRIALHRSPLADRWMLFAAVAFRILLDFSGYSDIAIGLARKMGVAIPANFTWPQISASSGTLAHL
jgi:alginate O-acetyltransferase complex protein AlgI